MKALRQTVDLSSYPDLVVVYLGMTVNMLTGIKTLLGFGPKIEGSVASRPDGLLLHENLLYSLFPLHVGMRQYWRDLESLERFTRTEPHREWWKQFLQDTGGTGFWHELYSARGGFEAMYVDVQRPIGFLRFAKAVPAKGGLFSARGRLHRDGAAETPAPYMENEV
jgi:fumigallin biosynthesis monooxygenase-like protein